MKQHSLSSFASNNPHLSNHSTDVESVVRTNSSNHSIRSAKEVDGSVLFSTASVVPNTLEDVQKKINKTYGSVGDNTPNTKHTSDSDSIYLEAELLMSLLAKGTYNVSMLNNNQKVTVLLYLYKFNKLIGRIIDLFVQIPLSGITLNYNDIPIENQVVNDYIQEFYTNLWEDLDFQEVITKCFRDYRLFGTGSALVSDDYSFSTVVKDIKGNHRYETILDFNNIKESALMLARDPLNKEELKEVREQAENYTLDKESLNLEEKQEIIYKFIPNLQGSDIVQLNLKDKGESWLEPYKGLKFIKNIDPYEVINRKKNTDINFYNYPLNPDSSLMQGFQEATPENLPKVVKFLVSLGYSKAYLKYFATTESRVDVTSYPYTEIDMWVATLDNVGAYSAVDKSNLNRIISNAVTMEIVARSNRNKAGRAYKKVTTFHVDETGDNFNTVKGSIDTAMTSEDSSYIVSNKAIGTDDISLDARQLVDIDNVGAKAEEDLIAGLGMTDALVTNANDSYANSYLKLELLNTEFGNERVAVARFIEKNIFEPIAIKKGFFVKDSWGKLKPLYPSISFGRINFARGSEDFSNLLSMAENGKIPYSVILKQMNFNPEDIERQLQKENKSIFNTNLQNYVIEKFIENDEFAKIILEDPRHLEGMLKALNINVSEEQLKTLSFKLEKRVLDEDSIQDLVETYDEKNEDDEVCDVKENKDL